MARAQDLRESLVNELTALCLVALKEAGFDASGNERLRESIADAIEAELHLWRTGP